MHQFENLVKLDATVSGTNKSSFFATFGDDCSYFFSVTRGLYFDSLCFKIDLKSKVRIVNIENFNSLCIPYYTSHSICPF